MEITYKIRNFINSFITNKAKLQLGMQIFYGCHSWKGHDVSEFQLRQPLTIISNYIQTVMNKIRKQLERASQKEDPPPYCRWSKNHPNIIRKLQYALLLLMVQMGVLLYKTPVAITTNKRKCCCRFVLKFNLKTFSYL